MTEPGFYNDIPEADYHADGDSLSVSGAKTLLRAPALFRWEQDNPVHKDVFDFGTAAHRLILGTGPTLVEVEADDWRTKAAKDARDTARAEGKVALLSADLRRVEDMADQLSAHTLAMTLLSGGTSEVSAYAPDEATGVMRRCRYDYLRDDLAVDYKTCATSDPHGFAKACANYGYYQQDPWYLDIADTLGKDLRGFVFIAQMKTPPYLVATYELEISARMFGRERNHHALERYRDCMSSGRWPGFVRDDQIVPIDLPRYAYYTNEEIA